MRNLTPAFVLNKLMEDCAEDMRELAPAVRTKSLELLAKYMRLFEEAKQGNDVFAEVGWGKIEKDKA
jgi:hypothetical protein